MQPRKQNMQPTCKIRPSRCANCVMEGLPSNGKRAAQKHEPHPLPSSMPGVSESNTRLRPSGPNTDLDDSDTERQPASVEAGAVEHARGHHPAPRWCSRCGFFILLYFGCLCEPSANRRPQLEPSVAASVAGHLADVRDRRTLGPEDARVLQRSIQHLGHKSRCTRSIRAVARGLHEHFPHLGHKSLWGGGTFHFLSAPPLGHEPSPNGRVV